MAKRRVSEDVIARRYLQLKLSRDRRRCTIPDVALYINSLKAWLKQSPERTKKPGGIGR